MDKSFYIETDKSSYTCKKVFPGSTNEKEFWKVDLVQGKVRGELILPGDWAPTRVLQYLESIDNAVA